jgi:predicted RNase H-like HicB family nuclease
MGEYHINIFWSDEDQSWVADLPDLAKCSAFGDTPEKALQDVLKAKQSWIEFANRHRVPVPKPRYRPAIYAKGTSVRRLATAVVRHGAAGAAVAAVRRMLAMARQAASSLEERWFDFRHRIDTTGIVHATQYEPVHPKAFADFLRYLPANRRELTLVDYGSGRGRAAFLAMEHGFGAAVGIELVPAYHKAAMANLTRYEEGTTNRGRVHFVLGDARELPTPSGAVVVFLFNPFPREVMIEVLEKLVRSLRADPRPAWLVYENPLDRDLLDDNPMFQLIGERTGHNPCPRRPWFAIYRVRPSSAADPSVAPDVTATGQRGRREDQASLRVEEASTRAGGTVALAKNRPTRRFQIIQLSRLVRRPLVTGMRFGTQGIFSRSVRSFPDAMPLQCAKRSSKSRT